MDPLACASSATFMLLAVLQSTVQDPAAGDGPSRLGPVLARLAAPPDIVAPESIRTASADWLTLPAPDAAVIGAEIDGSARAWFINDLAAAEIRNDTLGGVAIAITW